MYSKKGRDKRPAFDRLMKDATRRRFDVVMAWSVDRLGRSLQDLVAFLGEVHAQGVDLYLKGVFSHNDEMVRGIVSALRQIGKLVPPGEAGHIYVVGLDGTPLALDRIREGTQDATVAQDPYAMGGGGIMEQIIAYLEGQEYDSNMQTKPYLITKENVDDPRNWGNFGK